MFEEYGEILQDVKKELRDISFNDRDMNEKYEVAALLVEPEYNVEEQYYKDIDAVISGDLSPEVFYRKYFGEDPDPEIIEILEFLKDNDY